MSEREDKPSPQGVQETAAAWKPAGEIVRARPVDDFSVAEAARETMARFPNILAKLAE